MADGALSAAAVALACGLTYGTGDSHPEALFGTLLLVPLAFGVRAAVRAARAARRERVREAGVAGISDAEAASAAVSEERARMSADIQAVVRRSVGRISSLADEAASAPGEQGPRLREIQTEGRAAIAELRRQLGLLRADPEDVRTPAASGPGANPREAVGPVDVVLAVLAGLAALIDCFLIGPSEGLPVRPVQTVLTVTAALAVLLWRVNPGLACAVVGLLSGLGILLGQPLMSGLWMLIPMLLLWAAIARPVADRLAVIGPAGLVVSVLASEWIYFPDNTLIMVIIFAVAAAVAAAFRLGDAVASRARRRAGVRERELAAASVAAVVEARRSVARELHDSLSGSVGVIVTQAGAAELLWARDPDRAKEALAVVREAATAAVSELDALHVGLAQVAEAGSAARTLDDVPALVERMRRGGVEIRLEMFGETEPLPADVALTAYRIVQEGLANAARHAPGSRVRVLVEPRDAEVIVAVSDDGPGWDGRRAGYGLTGLVERVRQLGGSLVLDGDRDGDGFAVTARLPRRVSERTAP